MKVLDHPLLSQMKYVCTIILLTAAIAPPGPARGAEAFSPPGPNLALSKPYTIDPKPSYPYCTDPGDSEQLTDGEYVGGTDNLFWTRPGCVGWYSPGTAIVTIDLGEVSPIAGLSFSTAAGAADVGWPSAMLILVSDEGESFHYVGELRSLSAKFGTPAAFGLQEHRFRTDDFSTHGRFLRLAVVAGGPYLFCDEIEVYAGTQEMLAAPVGGLVVTNVDAFLTEHQTGIAIQSRIALDIARARAAVAAADLEADRREELNQQISALQTANETIPNEPGADYRAIFPLNDNHAGVFDLVAELRREEGFPPLFLWHTNRWASLELWAAPNQVPDDTPVLSVRMMSNERRAETLNIANFSDGPLTATVSFSGLPGGKTPEYITVQPAEYVAMQAGFWDANALPVASHDEDGWRISLPAGVSRQLWLSFYPQDSPQPGRYLGEVVVDIEGAPEKLTSPLRLVIEPLRFPEQTTLALGMWDYAHDGGAYDLNAGNIPAALAHMQSYHYNAPWAKRNLFPQVEAGHFDAAGNLIAPWDFSRFDAWVAAWPNAKYYMVYASVGTTFAGAAMGSDDFNQRLGSAMHAWADHAREIGTDPGQIGILLVDEPTEDEQDQQILAWAQIIKAAAPELLIFEDPHRRDARQHLREMLDICDILCPSRGSYKPGEAIAKLYDELRDGGRELWFYSGSCPSVQTATSFRRHAWHCWIAKATGTGYWSYGDAGGTCNSWNQLGTDRTIYSPVYIDATSVTDGKHWLAIIEGIQDYEYLRMLRDRVEELVAAGHSTEAIDEASNLLTTLPAEVLAGAVTCEGGRLQTLNALSRLREQGL